MFSTAAAIAPLLLLLQSCGLPGNIPSLQAPTVPSGYFPDQSNNVFQFENQPQTNPGDFFGFEIYYKFYDNTTNTGSVQYQSDSTQLSSTATGPTQLVSLGYRRAYLYPPGYQQGSAITLPATPLIPVTSTALKTTTYQVTIDLSSAVGVSGTSSNVYPAVDINGTSTGVTIGRYLGLPPNYSGTLSGGNTDMLEGFGSADFSYDQATNNGGNPPGDLPTTLTQPSLLGQILPSGILLGLYAIAYGFVNLTIPIYSTPTALGYVVYTSPTISIYPSNPS